MGVQRSPTATGGTHSPKPEVMTGARPKKGSHENARATTEETYRDKTVGGKGKHLKKVQEVRAGDSLPAVSTENRVGERKEDAEESGWHVAGAGGSRREHDKQDETKLEQVWQAGQEVNTKKKDNCSLCRIEVKDNQMALNCDLCQRWYHVGCVKVTKKEYDMISKIDEKVKWFCLDCGEQVKIVQEENSELRQRNRDLEEQNDELKMKLNRLERKVGDIELRIGETIERELRKISADITEKLRRLVGEKIGRHEEDITQRLSEIEVRRQQVDEERNSENHIYDRAGLRKEMEEMKEQIVNKGVAEVRKQRDHNEKQMQEVMTKIEEMEREKRKKNVVLFNMVESEAENPQNRYREDEEKCLTMFAEELEIQDLKIEKLIRLGKKQEGRNRPLLVKLGAEEERKNILKEASKLRHSENFRRVYINRDLTQTEREQEGKLREELRTRRSEEGSHYIIRRGKVIRLENRTRQETDGAEVGTSQEDSEREKRVGVRRREVEPQRTL